MTSARMFRKLFLFSLAILLTAFVFTACGVIDGADADEKDTKKTEAKGVGFSGGDRTISLPDGASMEMVKVEAGSFEMSARDGENGSDEVPHRVTLTRDFYLGRTEVTQAQWKAVMGTDPSYFKGDDLPVEKVSWNDAMEFCEKLNDSGKAPRG